MNHRNYGFKEHTKTILVAKTNEMPQQMNDEALKIAKNREKQK